MPKRGAEHPLTATRKRLAIAPRPHSKFLATYGIPTANVKTNRELLMTLDGRYVNGAGLGAADCQRSRDNHSSPPLSFWLENKINFFLTKEDQSNWHDQPMWGSHFCDSRPFSLYTVALKTGTVVRENRGAPRHRKNDSNPCSLRSHPGWDTVCRRPEGSAEHAFGAGDAGQRSRECALRPESRRAPAAAAPSPSRRYL